MCLIGPKKTPLFNLSYGIVNPTHLVDKANAIKNPFTKTIVGPFAKIGDLATQIFGTLFYNLGAAVFNNTYARLRNPSIVKLNHEEREKWKRTSYKIFASLGASFFVGFGLYSLGIFPKGKFFSSQIPPDKFWDFFLKRKEFFVGGVVSLSVGYLGLKQFSYWYNKKQDGDIELIEEKGLNDSHKGDETNKAKNNGEFPGLSEELLKKSEEKNSDTKKTDDVNGDKIKTPENRFELLDEATRLKLELKNGFNVNEPSTAFQKSLK